MNKIAKLTLVLFLVCAIVAGVLGGVYTMTKSAIAQQEHAKMIKAYSVVLESENYDPIPFDRVAFPIVDSVALASNGTGFVVMTTFPGAQGNITMAVGVDREYKCTGISITKHSETSGLGANAASTSKIGTDFRAQFVGQDDTCAITLAGGDIDALTGATITSRSVANATATAIKAVEHLG